nr:hypothetical protein [Tanacetum cinerariifolium]
QMSYSPFFRIGSLMDETTSLEALIPLNLYALYFLVPGLDLKDGLRSLKNDVGMRSLRGYALRNDGEIDVYMAHSEFDFDDTFLATIFKGLDI